MGYVLAGQPSEVCSMRLSGPFYTQTGLDHLFDDQFRNDIIIMQMDSIALFDFSSLSFTAVKLSLKTIFWHKILESFTNFCFVYQYRTILMCISLQKNI